MPQSTHPIQSDLAWRRELLRAIGQQRRAECELPEELSPELAVLLTSKDRKIDPYADIVGTC